MEKKLTAEDARQSLRDHVATKGAEICAKYGTGMGWKELMLLLEDREYVRYPCEVAFDESVLQKGEFANPEPKGATPEEGFKMVVHPYFATQPNRVPLLVLYQLVLVNYGDFVTSDDAETFGAAALGIPKEDYYQQLCSMADEISQN